MCADIRCVLLCVLAVKFQTLVEFLSLGRMAELSSLVQWIGIRVQLINSVKLTEAVTAAAGLWLFRGEPECDHGRLPN